jgi:hypothetical protein
VILSPEAPKCRHDRWRRGFVAAASCHLEAYAKPKAAVKFSQVGALPKRSFRDFCIILLDALAKVATATSRTSRAERLPRPSDPTSRRQSVPQRLMTGRLSTRTDSALGVTE